MFAILGVLMLVASMAPAPWLAEEAEAQGGTGDPGLVVTGSDYSALLPTVDGDRVIFGEDALAYVVLRDEGRSVADVRGIVNMTAHVDGETDGVEFALLETGIGTGVFRGAFGFAVPGGAHAPEPVAEEHPVFGKIGVTSDGTTGLARLEVESGDQISVDTDDGASPTRSANFKWFGAEDASFTITAGELSQDIQQTSHTFSGYDDHMTFQVTDTDLNTDPDQRETYTRLLKMFSTSELEGEWITLTETGDDNGEFRATIRFEETPTADNDRLHVQNEDDVHLMYEEPHTDSGEKAVHWFPDEAERWTFERAWDGTITTDRSVYYGETDPVHPHDADRAVIRIEDDGRRNDEGAKLGTVTVTAEVDNTGNSVPIDLQQLHAGSHTYLGELWFADTNQPGSTPPRLGVTEARSITLTYEDTGGSQRTRSITWVPMENPQIELADGDAVLVGIEQEYTIQVVDPDRMEQATVPVSVKTDTEPTSGQQVTLTQDPSNLGTFEGTFHFSSDEVSDGDRVVVEYADSRDETGQQTLFRSELAVWREPTEATLSTNALEYYERGHDDDGVVEILLEDLDQSSPVRRDSIEVEASLTNDPSTTHTVILDEIGTTSGVFYGQLVLGEWIDLPASGVDFIIQYEEPQADGSVEALESAPIVYRQYADYADEAWEPVLRLEQSKQIDAREWSRAVNSIPVERGDLEDLCEAVQVTVYGVDQTSVSVELDSDEASNPLDVGLARLDGEDVWSATVELEGPNDECSGANVLEVDRPDTVTGEFTPQGGDPVSVSADTREADESVRFETAGGSLLEETSGLNAASFVSLSDAVEARNSTSREVVEVSLKARADTGPGITALLVETEADSLEFEGNVVFTHDDTDTSGVRVLVEDDLNLIANETKGPDGGTLNEGYGLYSLVELDAVDASSLLLWYPGYSSAFNPEDRDWNGENLGVGAWGNNRPFDVRLESRDGLAHRVQETQTSEDGEEQYPFDDGPYIRGSDLVFVHRTDSEDFEFDESVSSFTVDAGVDREPIADRDRDAIIDCHDVTLTWSGDWDSDPDCDSVDAENGEITIDGTAVCNGNTVPVISACSLDVDYVYRAELDVDCDDEDEFHYFRYVDGIEFCDATPDGSQLEFDYTRSERMVTIRGPTESETVVLTYSETRSDPHPDQLRFVFRKAVSVEFTPSSNNGKIHVEGDRSDVDFYHADAVQDFDGRGGSAVEDHFRSLRSSSQWREAESGQVRVMRHDFSAQAQDVSYGPVLPIRVIDKDASRNDWRETVEVAVEDDNGASLGSGTLRETLPDSGEFWGVVEGIAPDTEVTVRYVDSRGSSGGDIVRITDILWSAAESADVQLCRDAECDDSVATGDLFRGLGAGFFIRVDDADSCMESEIDVRVVSRSDPIGETVPLSRSGTSEDCHFESQTELGFETQRVTDNDRVFVAPGDWFQVVYDDPMNAGGSAVRQESVEGEWRRATDGSVRIDRIHHIGEYNRPAALAPRLNGLDKVSLMTVAIEDLDLSENPATVNTLEFTGGTSGDAEFLIGPVKDGQDEVDPLRVHNDLRFVETAPGSGDFIGIMTFDGGHADFERFDAIARGERIRAEYCDPDPVNPNLGTGDACEGRWFTSEPPVEGREAKWFDPGFGVIKLDRFAYGDFGDSPRVTVYDGDLTGQEDEVSVTGRSDANPSGISQTLEARDDAPDGGLYTGTFSLSDSSSGTNLHVNPDDEIEMTYEDSAPLGARTTTAIFIEGLDEAPTTSMMTDPADPDGDNDWFLSAVEVDFDVTHPIQAITNYRIGEGGVQTLTPFTLQEGIHEITFWSEDDLGNVEDEQTVTIRVSLNDPEVNVESIETTPRPAGSVELGWEPIPGKGDPLRFGEYRIFRGPQGADFADTTFVTNATNENVTDTPTAGDSPPQTGETFTYYVLVANDAGRLGPVSDAVDGLSDRVSPEIDSFNVIPGELHEDEGEDTAEVELAVTESTEDDVNDVFLRVRDPFGEVAEEVDMDLVQGSTRMWSLQYSGFDECGLYNLHGVADDLAGNEGARNETVRFHAVDREAPRIVNFTDEIPIGQNLDVIVRDNCRGVASVEYTMEGQDAVNVEVPAQQPEGDFCHPRGCEVRFSIPADDLQPGVNRIRVVVADANETANEAIETVIVTVVEDVVPVGPPEIGDGSRLVEHGGTFGFTVDSAQPLTGLSLEADGLDLDDILDDWSHGTGQVGVSVAGLDPGSHSATVTATNPTDTAQKTFEFFVLEPGICLPPEQVIVSLNDDDRPVIEWTPSDCEVAQLGGYLVHRQTNPWEVIAVVDSDTTSYTDQSAQAGQSYNYAVTAYGPEGEGRLEVGDDPEGLTWFQNVGTTSFEMEEEPGGIPPVFLWVALIVLAVLVVVALLYVNRRQIFGSTEGEIYSEEYPDEAETPFGEDRHLIRCPNCTDEFHVSGERPVVTECPNCGRKGILR